MGRLPLSDNVLMDYEKLCQLLRGAKILVVKT